MKKFDLEDRLVDFAVMVIEMTEALPNTRAEIPEGFYPQDEGGLERVERNLRMFKDHEKKAIDKAA